MKILKIAILTASLAGVMSAQANLIINGGFETGDYAGWTFTPATSGSVFLVTSDLTGYGNHSGNFVANFGAVGGQDDTLSQTVATTPGGSYVFDFWLAANASSSMTVSWDRNTLLQISNGGPFGWTHYSYDVVASGNFTDLTSFAGRNAPSWIALDDVSLTAAVPEPSTYLAGALLLLPFGLQGIRHLRSRKQAA